MPLRFQVGAHINGQSVRLPSYNDVHAASAAAESFFRNQNDCTKTWVYDDVRGRYAVEKIPASEEFNMPKREYVCVWEKKKAA